MLKSLRPNAPKNLAVTGTTSATASLSWSAVTVGGGILEYRIYRNGVEVGTTTNLTFINTGLTASTAYIYTVTAVSVIGPVESIPSTPVTATTTA